MAIRTNAELLESARTILGDNTTDEAVSFLEDLSDTTEDYETRTRDNTDWHQRYDDNDKQWRQKYMARFSGRTEEDEDDSYEEPDPPKKTYLDLFTTEVK